MSDVPAPKRRSRKSKTAPVAPPDVSPPPGPEGEMALTERELLRLRLFDAEYRRHNAEATMRAMEKQALLRQLDPDNRLGLLDQSIRAASQGAAKAQEDHKAVISEVEKRLGISIQDYSFNDDTGKLFRQQTEEK